MLKAVPIIRFLLFAVFFLAGAGAVVLSILSEPELANYYHNKAMLEVTRQQNEKIKSLTEQYDAQVRFIESEPNVLERLRPMMLGKQPQADDIVFPHIQNETLRTETEEILNSIEQPPQADPTPAWLERILVPRIRQSLFFSGAGLVLVACIFFGTDRKEKPGVQAKR